MRTALLLAGATILCALAPRLAAADAPGEGRRLALVVGVDGFDDPRWPALRYAEKDARDVARALGRSFDRVIAVTGRPTRARVLAALDELARASTSDRDTVVVYVSTHGTLAYDARGELVRVLVLADTMDAQAIDTGLPHDELLTRLDRARSRRKLAVIASCHSGAGKSQLSTEMARDLRSLKGAFFTEPIPPPGEGRIVLAASAWGETAREDEGLQNDVYTHFFLQALAGFDLDQDGATTALEAHEFARRRTLEFTRGRQRPSLTAELVGEDPIVLAGQRQRLGHPMIASWAARFAGGVLEVDGREKGVLPGSFAIEPGARTIRVRSGDQVMLERDVEVAPGQVTMLESLLEGDARRWLSLSAAIGLRAVRDAEIDESYLPGRVVATLGGAWLAPDEGWRLGVEVGLSRFRHQVRLPDPIAGSVFTPVSVTLVDLALHGERRLLAWGPLALEAGGRLGLSVGHRAFEIATVAHRSQLVSVPWGGLDVGLTWAPTDTIALRVSAGLDLLVPSIAGSIRPVFSDTYQLGVRVRP